MATNAQRDPTRTVTLRRRYERACRKRFGRVRALVLESVVDNDALGLTQRRGGLGVLARAAGRYDFPSDPAGKAQAFLDWLAELADEEVLEVTQREGRRVVGHSAWQDVYVRAAYGRGLARADDLLWRSGVFVPDYGLEAAFNRPMHADALAMLFTRNFHELRGITEAMSAQIGQTLAQGLGVGMGAQALGRELAQRVEAVGMRRAMLMARTEVVRAFAEGTLNRFEEFGVREVTGEVEFQNAGDGRVCPRCRGLQGRVYTIAEARGVIPVHPQCRCAWLVRG